MGGLTRDRVAATDEPFSAAVTVAEESEISAPVLAVNDADTLLGATLTEEGTLNWDGELSERAIMVRPAADFDRVTVQVVLALGPRLVTAHCREAREDKTGRAVSESVVA